MLLFFHLYSTYCCVVCRIPLQKISLPPSFCSSHSSIPASHSDYSQRRGGNFSSQTCFICLRPFLLLWCAGLYPACIRLSQWLLLTLCVLLVITCHLSICLQCDAFSLISYFSLICFVFDFPISPFFPLLLPLSFSLLSPPPPPSLFISHTHSQTTHMKHTFDDAAYNFKSTYKCFDG